MPQRGILTALPAFWPGIGLLARAQRAGAVVLRDDLPFETVPGLHRARLRAAGGETWMSLPVRAAAPGTPIAEICLAPTSGFASRTMRAIEHAFGEAPYFEHLRCDVARLLFREWPRFAPLATAMTRFLFAAYDVRAEVMEATQLRGGIAGGALPHRHCPGSDRSALDALFWLGPAARSLLAPPRRKGPPRAPRPGAEILHLPMVAAR